MSSMEQSKTTRSVPKEAREYEMKPRHGATQLHPSPSSNPGKSPTSASQASNPLTNAHTKPGDSDNFVAIERPWGREPPAPDSPHGIIQSGFDGVGGILEYWVNDSMIHDPYHAMSSVAVIGSSIVAEHQKTHWPLANHAATI